MGRAIPIETGELVLHEPYHAIVLRRLHQASRLLPVGILILAATHLFLELVPLRDWPGDILLRRLLDFSSERSVITWLSASLWLVGAALAAAIGLHRGHRGHMDGRWWSAFALVPLAISIDEIAGAHEMLSEHLRRVTTSDGMAATSWVIPEILLGLVVVAGFLPFLRKIPRWLSARLVVAAAVAITGAVGVEFVSFFVYEDAALGRTSRVYAFVSAVEETLELFGAYLLMAALVAYLSRELGVAHSTGASVRQLSS